MNTVSLHCKACGGELTVDEGREVLLCPYCGSKELIAESDEVRIERLRLEHDMQVRREEQIAEEKKQKRADRDDKTAIITLVIMFIVFIIIYHFLPG